jgi:LacI family transcriptional regulator
MGKGLLGGMILMAPSLTDEIKEIIQNYTASVVIINGGKDLRHYDSVSIDNYNGAYALMEHLIKDKKYKEIAHIKGPEGNIDAYEREKGYLDALKDNKIQIRKEWIVQGDFSVRGGEAAFNAILNLHKKPRAIFAANDMTAIGCYKAAEAKDIIIPHEMGIVGYDGVFVGKFLTPKLTTVEVPTNELGRTAAKLLLDRIKFPNGKGIKHIKIPTQLRIANSC